MPEHASLPPQVRGGLEKFSVELRRSAGDRLISVILYGGLAKGDFAPARSNVNVMVVLREAGLDALESTLGAFELGRSELRLAPLVLSEGDLSRTSRLFPAKFLDMKRAYRVLYGRDVLEQLTIEKEHLRFRCAQEMTNQLLRLRQFYIRRERRPELLEQTLTRSISPFLASVGVLLSLKGMEVSRKPEVISQAEKDLGLDGEPLREVLAVKRGDRVLPPAALKELYGRVLAVVGQAADLAEAI